jgi:hypothetical protein
MEIQMAFFEAKAAAVTSALTLLIPVASFHSALSQENSVTAPARLAAQDDILGFLLVHFDIAYADADQSIEGAAPRPVQTASQSKSRLAAAQPRHSPANAPNEVNEMPTSPPVGAPAGSTTELPQDLSAWGMFLHADRVVKAVMIGLALASLATWAIWLAKALELSSARREVQKDLRLLANCSTLSEAHGQLVKGTSSVAQLMQGAADEIRASINFSRAHHQSCGGRARHCRGVACDRPRSRGRNPRGCGLQPAGTFDRAISRTSGRRLRTDNHFG